MVLTKSGLPNVKLDTIKSIVGEVFDKNADFGLSNFESLLQEENLDMHKVVYTFIDSISDSLPDYTDRQREELSAIAKMACHLMYKGMTKQLEINDM